ncbi:MAG TPA: CsbD family protein [Terracidiphilus sp.]|jgi:uncharacterized protein YjbJ (UPF0337 family)|nr:CsbD family protein [Terracidiphilus sp.]
MDKDRIKGAVDDTVGRAKRQAGEWTGDTQTQAEGAAQQIKGKAEKAWGNVKDAAKDATKDTRTDADREHDRRVEAERDREAEHAADTTHNRR